MSNAFKHNTSPEASKKLQLDPIIIMLRHDTWALWRMYLGLSMLGYVCGSHISSVNPPRGLPGPQAAPMHPGAEG
ncbi:hypothetical protein BD310DRAFT_927552 [Dichomitus squalens]|uniref:Uncharacterized protein n=1 Tax=Dichomitus squalens TaxID=114155 RepID=A0A4Q9PUL0_9APHY|nr:hypothetical protein BD310DRAFT_927552 [Dichomitus squalens]